MNNTTRNDYPQLAHHWPFPFWCPSDYNNYQIPHAYNFQTNPSSSQTNYVYNAVNQQSGPIIQQNYNYFAPEFPINTAQHPFNNAIDNKLHRLSLQEQNTVHIKREFDNRVMKRNRRERTTYTQEQLNVLRSYFKSDQYPDINSRQLLALKIGLTEGHVQVWFKNRRAKERTKAKVVNSSVENEEENTKEEPEINASISLNSSNENSIAIRNDSVSDPNNYSPYQWNVLTAYDNYGQNYDYDPNSVYYLPQSSTNDLTVLRSVTEHRSD